MGIKISALPRVVIAPKLLLFDIDGTLVRSNHSVDERLVEKLKYLSSRGVMIGFASGRASFGARHLYQQLSVNAPSMFFSGSLVEDPKNQNAIFSQGLAHSEIIELAAAARKLNIYTELYTADQYLVERTNYLTELHAQYMNLLPLVGEIEEFSQNNQILKVVLIADSVNSIKQVRELAAQFSDLNCGLSFGAAHPELLFANFTSQHAARLIALDRITQALGLNRSEVAAFGDAESDLPLLLNCGYGFALANAPQNVRDQAPFITDHIEEGGVLTALNYLYAGVT